MTSTNRHNWLALFACLASFALLLFQLDAKSLWVDELSSVAVIRMPDIPAVVSSVSEQERRPPLYHLMLHLWTTAAGTSDFSLRLLSVLLGVLGVALTYRVGATLLDRGTGLLASWLLAMSPTFVLYARMTRYYSLVVVLGLLSCYFFLRLLKAATKEAQSSRIGLWAGYLGTSGALVFADYPAWALLLGQNLFFLMRWRQYRPLLTGWIAAQGLLLAGSTILLGPVSLQAARDLTAADLATSPLGIAMKLSYPFYSFSVGETLFPWHPAAFLGLATVAFLLFRWLATWKDEPEASFIIVLPLVLSIAFVAAITSTVASDITFLATASRSLFVAPFFYLALARGATAVRGTPVLWLPLFGMLLVWGVSLRNLYGGWDFHNPIYIIPAREIAAEVAARASPEDVVVSDGDSAFGYYYERGNYQARHFDSSSTEATDYIEERRSPQVWLITLGRDRTRWMAPTQLIARLEQGYERVTTQGWAEQDATYRQVKELLLGRPAYRYKVELSLYQRKEAT